MGGSAAQGDGTSAYGMDILANSALQQKFYTDAAMTTPYLNNTNVNDLQTEAGNVAKANAYNSNLLEAAINPQVYRARQELNTQVADDLQSGGELGTGNDRNDVSNVLQRSAIRSGLTGAINAGVGAGSTIGQARLANALGEGVINYRNQNQAKAASLLAANPQAQAGLDPGSFVSLQQGLKQGNLNTLNAKQQQDLAFGQQAVLNNQSQLQNSMGITAQQAGANAQLAEARYGANLAAFSQIAAAAAGGASSAAKAAAM